MLNCYTLFTYLLFLYKSQRPKITKLLVSTGLTELRLGDRRRLQLRKVTDTNSILSGNSEQVLSSLCQLASGQLQRLGVINLRPRLLARRTHLHNVSGDGTSAVQLRWFPLESDCALSKSGYRQVPRRIRFAFSHRTQLIIIDQLNKCSLHFNTNKCNSYLPVKG